MKLVSRIGRGLAAATIAAALCTLPLPHQTTATAADAAVAIRNLPRPGGFEVVNGGTPVELIRKVTVQREYNGAWHDEVADLALVASCDLPRPGRCVTLAGDATLRPVPWNGMSCASQCPASCRANVYYGPGRFRFVLTDCGSQQKIYGPAFDMPPYR
jgi:hypothetical protein